MQIKVRIQLAGTDKHSDVLTVEDKGWDVVDPTDAVRDLMQQGRIGPAKSQQGKDVLVNWSHVAVTEVNP